MKTTLQQLIFQALEKLFKKHDKTLDLNAEDIQISTPKDKKHGDAATNISLILAKKLSRNPKEIAHEIIELLAQKDQISSTEIAGPGFINFFFNQQQKTLIIQEILKAGHKFGDNSSGANQKIHIEYVSANPTGPLHVGHGRGAAYGASLANILKANGYLVHREYYVNDAGRQMNILAVSLWLRYLALCNPDEKNIELPENAYQGDYIIDIAKALFNQYQTKFTCEADDLLAEIEPPPPLKLNNPDLSEKESKDIKAILEKRMDQLIKRAQELLGSNYQLIFDAGLTGILEDIREDLSEFGVKYDNWFSERSLAERKLIDEAIEILNSQDLTYKVEDTLWFKSSLFGDDKDRVLIRDNGQPTYFASDIAYHYHKANQNYTRIIDIWGADHHGYIARVQAALKALTKHTNPSKKTTDTKDTPLKVLLVQFAILYRQGQRVQMSTRSGSFVTLRELRQEVGNDAARFFYVMRKSEQHMDFDLDLAKSQNKDNPVYYIQYAHARICKLIHHALDQPGSTDNTPLDAPLDALLETLGNTDLTNLSLLTHPQEEKILKTLQSFTTTLIKAANNSEPHLLAHYLKELASNFHAFYNDLTILKATPEIMRARLALSIATKICLAKGLELLGVSAPKSM